MRDPYVARPVTERGPCDVSMSGREEGEGKREKEEEKKKEEKERRKKKLKK